MNWNEELENKMEKAFLKGVLFYQRNGMLPDTVYSDLQDKKIDQLLEDFKGWLLSNLPVVFYVPIDVEKELPGKHDRYLVIMEDGTEDMAWYMDETKDWQSFPNDEQPVKWLKKVSLGEIKVNN